MASQLPTICLVCEDQKSPEGHLQVHRFHQDRLQTLISAKVSEIIALPVYSLYDSLSVDRHATLLFQLSYLKWQRGVNEKSFRESYNSLMSTCICAITATNVCNCFHCLLEFAKEISFPS
jgi:hypothetical protein